MINENSILAVKNANFSKKFCRPLYSNYCFSKIPFTIERLLLGESENGLPKDVHSSLPFDHVILFFLDGFGWTFYEKYKAKIPLLQKIEKEGILSKLTSMFPSTTAAHVTCINTGLCPNQSGLYEWFIFEPKLNDLIAPLPFSYAGDRKTETLPIDPRELYPKKSIYEDLAKKGITSFAIQPHSIAHSSYSQSVLKGSQVIGYKNPIDAFEQVIPKLKNKTYVYFYYSEIDSIGHRHGIFSEKFQNAIEMIFFQIEQILSKLPSKTAVLITADHGMVDVYPEKTYYLNKNIPNIEKYLFFGKRNKPLAPAGSCRDLFLHVLPEYREELKEILQEFLKEKGEVFSKESLFKEQLFGNTAATQNFLKRVGDLIILPYKGESVWWYEKNRFEQNFYAAHGGLTREEMEIPFLFYS